MMKNIKRLALLMVLVMLMSMVYGCSNSSSSSSGSTTSSSGSTSATAEKTYKPVVWKVSYNAAPGQAMDQGLVKFSALVEERTAGRVKFELFPNNVLGSDTSTREMLVEGTIDMLAIGGGYMGVFNGACDLVNMLYNFSNRDELLHMYDSEWGQKYIYEPFLKNQNIRVIDYWPNNDRMTICTKPIRSVSDLSGVKIRIPSGYVTQESVWTDLGAMTVTMALGDALTGMQQGVIDAVEMPIDFIYSYGFHEVAKYLSLTSHSIYAQLIFVNEKSFQAISPDDQKVVLDTIKECGIYATDLLDKREMELKTEMVQK